MVLKIPIHSVTDLITNSSTTIFTYSGGSVSAVKDMVNEFFKTFGINKTCDEVFDTVILCDKYQYSESKAEGIPGDVDAKDIYEKVLAGEMEKPEWFKIVEDTEDDWSFFTPSTYLHLIPKSPEYKDLANLIHKFLYSTDHDGTRDG